MILAGGHNAAVLLITREDNSRRTPGKKGVLRVWQK